MSYAWNVSRNAMHWSWLRPAASSVSVWRRRCWVNFQKVPSISSSLQIRRYLQLSVNLQNGRVYMPCSMKKHDIAADRLLRTRPTFSKSVMVSVAVSKLGFTELIFAEPVVKADGAYYWDVLLSHQMLSAMRHLAGNVFVFQQDSAPAHRARAIVEYLHQATPEFISPDYGRLTALTLTRSIIRFGAVFRSTCTRSPYVTWISWNNVWSRCGLTCNRQSSMRPLVNGGRDSGPGSVRKDIILNICFHLFTLSVVC